jgi:uncharacterized surface protein with fasciclin (FAS1) repeats
MLRNRFLTASLLMLFFGAMAQASHHEMKESNIVSVAKEAGSFKTLLTALDAAGLTATLEGKGPFTVFAPTDAAFAALPAGTLEGLLADKAKLAKVLTYHVVAGDAKSGDLVNGSSLTTLEGGKLSVSTVDGVRIGGATVVGADVDAGNGVIHVIDRVLIPAG